MRMSLPMCPCDIFGGTVEGSARERERERERGGERYGCIWMLSTC